MIQPLILDVIEGARAPGEADITKVDRVLVAIAQELSKTKDLALVDIVDELINKHLIRDGSDDRVSANQLVFCFVGWLSK